jgi:tripartite-type tricarboxylate transporter receptor subunit TctC
MTHVPYKGTGPLLTDLLAGNVQLSMSPIGVMLPHVKSGRLRGLAVSSVKRNSAMPDVPTIAETLPGYEAPLWYGFWGPRGLPRNIVNLWNAETRKAAQSADVKQRFVAEGIDAADGPPELFRDAVQRDVTKWIKVVQTANIKPIQ